MYSRHNLANNPLHSDIRHGLRLELTDNGALGGRNLSLCITNLIWSLLAFLMACVSFYSKCYQVQIPHEKIDSQTMSILRYTFMQSVAESYA